MKGTTGMKMALQAQKHGARIEPEIVNGKIEKVHIHTADRTGHIALPPDDLTTSMESFATRVLKALGLLVLSVVLIGGGIVGIIGFIGAMVIKLGGG